VPSVLIALTNLTTPGPAGGVPGGAGGPAGAGVTGQQSPGGPASYLGAQPGQPGFTPPPLNQRLGPDGFVPSGMPPPGETRFIANNVVMQLSGGAIGDALRAFLESLNIRVISLDPLGALGGSVALLELPPGMTLRPAMAGAIASRDRLLGVAPEARIIAVRAFGESNNTAEGTSLGIIKGVEWAMSQNARIINMSFAGPRDPALERALKIAYDKGMIMVGAAGNAGPKSPPLYPGADPHVISVTATDVKDRGFRGANQGPQLSVAAPGVEVLAPAPEENYQMSTGTSIATAHVSGVVALMLERNPRLTPTEVRRILEETATDLGPKGKDAQFGWGLVNPQKALEAAEARIKSSEVTKP
jgi:subtilase family protein